jgi:NAD(P)H-hydrate epimerase
LAYAAQFPEAMWIGLPESDDGSIAAAGWKTLHEKLPQASAVVVGPGLGRHAESLGVVSEVLKDSPHSTVIDADAIQPEAVAAARGKPVVFTPHAGEFARVAGARDLRAFCRDEKVFTVLKGPVTRVCERDTVYHSFFGGPVLARGGSGDMLAGIIGGLLAQDPDKVLLAACRGVVWHGAAADLLARDKGQGAVQASQLLDYFRPALLAAENEA